jgi:peptide/nickel transport system permease protein
MAQYLIRRLVQALINLLIISMLIFGLVSAMPGGMMSAYEENPNISEADKARIRAKFGLDDPLPVQYFKWLGRVMQGDWGDSFQSKRPAIVEIGERLPNTLLLMGVMLVVTLLIAIPLGVFSAIKKYSIFDQVTTTLAFAGQSLPTFWFGLLLILGFAVWIKGPDGNPLLPGSGMATLGEPFSIEDRIRHLILPVTMLALISAAGYMRYMRSAMLDVIGQDYVRTARAKGAHAWLVIYKHAFRNALIPLVTLIGLDLPALFGGALFTETIFAWPGIARLYWNAALKGDIPVVMAVLIIDSALVIASVLLVDIVYTMVDPRIRLS